MEPQVKSNLVLILDYGSQYTHLITRRIRKLSLFSLCISGSSSLKAISDLNPRVIILSGGPHSVHSENSPCFPDGFVEYVEKNGVLCWKLGGEVSVGEKQEYGRMEIEVVESESRGLFGNRCSGDKQVVWMSHGDEAVKLPDGFRVVARSQQGSVAAIEDRDRRFFGLQYHPEVTHSPEGMETLRNFLFDVCGVVADWKMEDVLEEEIKKYVGALKIMSFVLCLVEWILQLQPPLFIRLLGRGFIVSLLTMVQEERACDGDISKRSSFACNFSLTSDSFSQELENKLGKKPVYLVQGTLYPDVIESRPPPGSGRTHSHTIKSHHNVGGLPKDMKLKLIEPLKLLFKDEVRELGRILNVPEAFLKRHPFHGPGLAVRVLGDVMEGNALETLCQVDEIFIRSIKEAGLYDFIWQAFAVFLPIRSVGVQGDQRTHSHVVALRAVTS
ncbi:LOW QUALITY PROTEIN: Glutamine amidotransferase [Dillenia turbinata]|uniref:GMP synthase (glutamine-hydrolyzing) n=1 Tax=Dillenia turbinata TaxID=194707 RepID=A0AAN8WDG1_9MAGN